MGTWLVLNLLRKPCGFWILKSQPQDWMNFLKVVTPLPAIIHWAALMVWQPVYRFITAFPTTASNFYPMICYQIWKICCRFSFLSIKSDNNLSTVHYLSE